MITLCDIYMYRPIISGICGGGGTVGWLALYIELSVNF